MKFISICFIAAGLLTSLWVSTALLGKARSQEAPTMDVPPPATSTAIPSTTLPAAKPSAEQVPSPNTAPALPSASVEQVPSPNSAPPLPPAPVDKPTMGKPAQVTEAFVPNVPGSDGYVYDPTGRRDPFRPFGMVQAPAHMPDTALSPVVESTDPLQTYDLAQLKVVGIIWQVASPKAVVKDPAGKIHMIKKDSKIGRNNGFVSVIREGEIVVVEPAIGDSGLPTATTRVMVLVR